MVLLSKWSGEKSAGRAAYDDAIRRLKQSGLYDKLSSLSDNAELTEQEKSLPGRSYKSKDFSNKIKKCLSCDTELTVSEIQCPECGSGLFIWEARDQTDVLWFQRKIAEISNRVRRLMLYFQQ